MEKRNSEIKNHHSADSRVILNIFRSRFFLFIVGFVALIIASSSYSKRNNNAKKAPVYQAPNSYSNSDTTRNRLVAFALQQIGTSYAEAGKEPSTGFDCSGFTQYVFKSCSITIPPSSITQSEFGSEVGLNDVKKGDLIFFKSPTVGNNNIGHVGIVISDVGEKVFFVHSSTNRGVIIDSLEQKHYNSRYKMVRRVIKD